jgi:hypothetical protein
VPNLSSLARPRSLAVPTFKGFPTELVELPDTSLIIADGDVGFGGGPAWQVWPDGSRAPQQLPPVTANASCVLPVDGDGYLVVSFLQNRVERTGIRAWKRKDLVWPWAAVVDGNTVLVTVQGGGGRVERLDLGSGATVGTGGVGTLQEPNGIAVVAATGEVVVADNGTTLVHVSYLLWSGLVAVCVHVGVHVCGWRSITDEKRESFAAFSFLFSLLIPPLAHTGVGRCLPAPPWPRCAPSVLRGC